MDTPAQLPAPVDFRRYLLAIWRRKWLALAVFVAIAGAMSLHTFAQPKIYSATASMIIDTNEPRFLADQQQEEVVASGPGTYWFNKEYYETQYKVILSRAVSERVVERLGLSTDASFLGLEKISDAKARAEAAKKIDAVSLLQSKISVLPVKDSRLVNIVVEDRSPERAALLANEVADAYIAETIALKLKLTENASKWLEERLDELEQATKKSELAVFGFQKQADMLTGSLEDKASIITQDLNHYDAALTDARTEVARLRAHVDAIKHLQAATQASDPLWAEGIPGTEGTVLGDLRISYAKQRGECTALAERYLANYPLRVACDQKLSLLKQDLVRELSNVVRRAETELLEATEHERNLSALFQKAKAEAFQVNRHQIEYDQLKRDADNNQRLYEMVLKRTKDLDLSGMLRTSNARVLDAARPVPTPVKPRIRVGVLLALVLGLLGGLGSALGLELLDDSISTHADVEERLGLAFLGALPRVENGTFDAPGRDLEVHRNPRSLTAEACRTIRTNLLFMSPDRPLKKILITSSGPQEGKSTASINLAVTMAQSGSRVLLVDTDLRRPRLHHSFGFSNERGLTSIIVGESSFEQAVRSTEVPRVDMLPCGPLPPNPTEVLHTDAFKALLAKAAASYDRIILDSPPVNAVADALVLATQVDGVVMLVKAGRTARASATRTVRALDDVQARIFGAVLNDVNTGDPKYAGYYPSYYVYAEAQEGA